MRLSGLIITVTLVAAGACSSGGQAQPSAGRAAAGLEWRDFHGIEYQVPAATTSSVQESVLPGPGGQGGIPSGVRPTLRLSLAGPHGFYVEIVRSSQPTTLEGMKQVLRGNKIGSHFAGTDTASGWELTYDQTAPDGTPQGTVHMAGMRMAGAYFECTYAEANCSDPAAAQAICRSLRPKAKAGAR